MKKKLKLPIQSGYTWTEYSDFKFRFRQSGYSRRAERLCLKHNFSLRDDKHWRYKDIERLFKLLFKLGIWQ